MAASQAGHTLGLGVTDFNAGRAGRAEPACTLFCFG